MAAAQPASARPATEPTRPASRVPPQRQHLRRACALTRRNCLQGQDISAKLWRRAAFTSAHRANGPRPARKRQLQALEQGFSVLEVWHGKSLGERAERPAEDVPGIAPPILPLIQPRKAHRGSKLPRLALLPPGDSHGPKKELLDFRRLSPFTPGKLAFQTVQLGFMATLVTSVHDRQGMMSSNVPGARPATRLGEGLAEEAEIMRQGKRGAGGSIGVETRDQLQQASFGFARSKPPAAA